MRDYEADDIIGTLALQADEEKLGYDNRVVGPGYVADCG